MDFDESIAALATRTKKLLPHIKTEEATKQALVVPFLQAMGYDPSDPTEVVPEFVADFATKKGEKVDYAILRHGKPIMVVECKWSGMGLDSLHAEQLYRYFNVTGAKVGILTNGISYRFFTDLEKANQLDGRPFLEFNVLDA
ncbi:MAG: type I restriction enzyme HsdR N-terminal domain-containing protein, partial [Magnetococcales bacterium]|nr:type I restriction enzyme HsdR N-terminal domain-containing protein [Magnetococcales bacterium]